MRHLLPCALACLVLAACSQQEQSSHQADAPKPSDCPELRIGSQVAGTPSRRVNFALQLPTLAVEPTFNWSVSSGTIISGQGNASIFVDAPPGPVTATVEVGGLDPSCKNLASETAEIP